MQLIPPPGSQRFSYLPAETEGGEVDAAGLRASIRWPVLAGIGMVILFVAAFGGWAATAPLAGGAVAPGILSPDGSRKTIQHLEGGIIAEIMVRDGDFVNAGAPLVTLEDTQARTVYDVLLGQYNALRAVQSRLIAEQLESDAVEFPEDLLTSDDPEVKKIVAMQRQLFVARREAHASGKRVLRQRIVQIRDQIRGLEAQLASTVKRLEIVNDELKAKEYLFSKDLLPKPELFEVRRAQADIEGDRGEYSASIAQSEQQIGETELQLFAQDAERAQEIAQEIDRVRGELAKITEQLGASEDTLGRTVITAPVSRTVVGLSFKTHGGVIQPGEPILDIVPADDDLLIDARVAPVDIDVVHPGLRAKVHLSAYSQRNLPQIDGIVRSVSADSLHDQQTGMSYYLARVEVDRDNLAHLGSNIQLVAGMPAEVLIVTEQRTRVGYLSQPFRDMFRRALREV
jgi:HlyD family secretion protein/epimerase transport system membrane fusion protein